jgi:hypothetical protein
MKFGLFIAAACVVSVGPDVVVIASAMGLPELVFLLLVLSVAAAMVWVSTGVPGVRWAILWFV